jgi:type IV pilus assembly protein PilP
MQFRQAWKAVLLIALSSCVVWGCESKEKPSAPTPVSKKIAIQNESKPSPATQKGQPVASSQTGEEKKSEESEPILAQRIYNPKERINPFLPLFRSENKEVAPEQPSKSKRKKRIPQTPLEKISLEQLKLVAIIRASSGNRALVEDSSGKGYIVKKGTYIGLNAGIVTQINVDRIIIEEELENLMGELVLQNTEMKLQKPAGE